MWGNAGPATLAICLHDNPGYRFNLRMCQTAEQTFQEGLKLTRTDLKPSRASIAID